MGEVARTTYNIAPLTYLPPLRADAFGAGMTALGWSDPHPSSHVTGPLSRPDAWRKGAPRTARPVQKEPGCPPAPGDTGRPGARPLVVAWLAPQNVSWQPLSAPRALDEGPQLGTEPQQAHHAQAQDCLPFLLCNAVRGDMQAPTSNASAARNGASTPPIPRREQCYEEVDRDIIDGFCFQSVERWHHTRSIACRQNDRFSQVVKEV